MKYSISLGGKKFSVEINQLEGEQVSVTVNGVPYTVTLDEPPRAGAALAHAPEPRAVSKPIAPMPTLPPSPAASAGERGVVMAPIPGKILEVRVSVGESVAAGQVVAVMEAMKMENNLTAPHAGAVKEVRVQKGSDVATGDVIMVIE
jgi:biotin carboxyl carrier protein